jgi:hypothetical protein
MQIPGEIPLRHQLLRQRQTPEQIMRNPPWRTYQQLGNFYKTGEIFLWSGMNNHVNCLQR